MYKYMLNSVVKISLLFAQYFEYYGIILRGRGIFSWTHCITKFCAFKSFKWYQTKFKSQFYIL